MCNATTQRKKSSLHFELQKALSAQRAWLPRAQSTVLLQSGLSQDCDMITLSWEACASAILSLATSQKPACALFIEVLQDSKPTSSANTPYDSPWPQ
jgi:hypothetical protein